MWGAVLGVLPCRWVAECVGNGPPIRAAILFPSAALCGADWLPGSEANLARLVWREGGGWALPEAEAGPVSLG